MWQPLQGGYFSLPSMYCKEVSKKGKFRFLKIIQQYTPYTQILFKIKLENIFKRKIVYLFIVLLILLPYHPVHRSLISYTLRFHNCLLFTFVNQNDIAFDVLTAVEQPSSCNNWFCRKLRITEKTNDL